MHVLHERPLCSFPLSFFPTLVQRLFLLLPFSYLYYLPMRIYRGKTSPAAAGGELLMELVWIAVLALGPVLHLQRLKVGAVRRRRRRGRWGDAEECSFSRKSGRGWQGNERKKLTREEKRAK
jgi:hypothetical protein